MANEKAPTEVGAVARGNAARKKVRPVLKILKKRSEHNIKAGSIVVSDSFGEGVVVGFSNITENPLVYFYDYDKLIGVDINTIRVV